MQMSSWPSGMLPSMARNVLYDGRRPPEAAVYAFVDLIPSGSCQRDMFAKWT